MDDTDLYVWLPELKTSEEVWREMQDSVLIWGELLNVTGGALKPEKCYWSLVDYACYNGTWEYATLVNRELLIPLPDGRKVPIKQLDVNQSEKMLGVWSCADGDDTAHFTKRVLPKLDAWISRTTNGHLPAKLNWMSYKFKLWPGLRYGLATLSTPLSVAQTILGNCDYKILPLLGVNRHVKRGYRTLP